MLNDAEQHLPKLIASLLNDQGYSRVAGGWLTATPVANQVELLAIEDEETPIRGYLITVQEVVSDLQHTVEEVPGEVN